MPSFFDTRGGDWCRDNLPLCLGFQFFRYGTSSHDHFYYPFKRKQSWLRGHHSEYKVLRTVRRRPLREPSEKENLRPNHHRTKSVGRQTVVPSSTTRTMRAGHQCLFLCHRDGGAATGGRRGDTCLTNPEGGGRENSRWAVLGEVPVEPFPV